MIKIETNIDKSPNVNTALLRFLLLMEFSGYTFAIIKGKLCQGMEPTLNLLRPLAPAETFILLRNFISLVTLLSFKYA